MKSADLLTSTPAKVVAPKVSPTLVALVVMASSKASLFVATATLAIATATLAIATAACTVTLCRQSLHLTRLVLHGLT